MHIAFHSPSWPPAGAANGIVTYVAALRSELARNGHRVSVVTVDGVHSLDDAKVVPARSPGVLQLGLLSRWDSLTQDTTAVALRLRTIFADLHRRDPIDIIEMEESFGWSRDIARIGVPVVTRLHGPEFCSPTFENPRTRSRRSAVREPRERKAIHSARAITAPTRATLEATRVRYDVRSDLLRVIPNPVPEHDPDARWNQETADPNLLLWVGAFTYIKGADLMLSAFDRLLEERPELRLEMVGADTGLISDKHDTMHFEDYCRTFLRPEVRERIRFNGILTPEQLLQRRRSAGLAVLTSRTETFSYAATESMALGLPIVATRWPASEEVILHGETGLLVEPDSAAALAEGIARALSMPDEMARLGARAAQFCRDHYAPSLVGQQTVEFYEEVLAGRPRRSADPSVRIEKA